MRRSLVGRLACGAVAATLGISLALVPVGAGGVAWAADAATTLEDALDEAGKGEPSEKSELVYALADARGTTKGLFVLDGAATSGLTSGSGLAGAGVSSDDLLDALDGSPLLYDGDLTQEFPWKVSVSYRLGGLEVGPDELKGASGEVVIELTVEPLPEVAANADFAESSFLQVQGSFDAARLSDVEAEGATVQTASGVTTVSAFLLPGESGSWRVTGMADDFESYGWQLSAMRLDADVNLREYDLSQLTDAADELESATSQLASGGAALTAALGQASTGTAQLDTGAQALATGTSALDDGLAQLKSGMGALAGGVDQLAGLSGTMDDARTLLGKLRRGMSGLEDALADLQSCLSDGAAATLLAQAEADGASLSESLTVLETQLKAIDATFGGAADDATAAAKSARAAASELDGAEAALAALVEEQGLTDDEHVAALEAALAAACQHVDTSAEKADSAATSVAGGRAAYMALVQGIDQAKVQALLADVDALVEKLRATGIKGTDIAAAVDGALGEADGLLAGAQDGVDQLQSAAHALSDGAAAASEGATAVAEGASALASGTSQLSSGMSQLADGSAGLQTGLDALAATFAGLDDKVIDEAQKKIDELLGADWQPHSFVDPANTSVTSVTFALVVDGIK